MKTTSNRMTDKMNKKKSLTVTIAVHTALLMLGLIPLTSGVVLDNTEADYLIPIEFASFAQSSDEGLQAKSPVPDPEHKPVTEKQETEPDIVEEEVIEEVAQVTEESEPVESEIVEEQTEEVAASEDLDTNDAETPASEGGSDATLEEGVVEGNDTAGEDEGQNGVNGDGVITRKIIYRQDISQAAYQTGVIVVDICIDRQGKVLTASNNSEETTIQDMDMVREALHLTAGYRFEVDYSAAKRECGSLTFIFDIEGGHELADYAMSE